MTQATSEGGSDHGQHPDAGAGTVTRIAPGQWAVVLRGGAVMAGFPHEHEAEGWARWYRGRLAVESTCSD